MLTSNRPSFSSRATFGAVGLRGRSLLVRRRRCEQPGPGDIPRPDPGDFLLEQEAWDSQAIYANIGYNFSEDLRVSVVLRYTQDDKTAPHKPCHYYRRGRRFSNSSP